MKPNKALQSARGALQNLQNYADAFRDLVNARVEKFRAGHAAHLETPDAFEAALERFLAELGDGHQAAPRALRAV